MKQASLILGIEDENISTAEYQLYQNYPNPFNPVTKISYVLPKESNVELTIYDIQGKEITNLINEKQESGRYEVDFNAANLPSGVYIYKLTAGNFQSIKKLTLLK